MVPSSLLLAALTPFASGEGTKVAAYELDVRFEPADGTLAGEAVVYVDPDELHADSLVFFLHGELRAEAVLAGERRLEVSSRPVFHAMDYSLIAQRVEVRLEGVELEEGLTVRYSGAFHPSGARSPSDYMSIDADGVHLRGFGYSPWFPVFLDADEDSYEVSFLHVRLDTPEAFVPVFTGTLLDSGTEDGRRWSEWEATCDLLEAQCTARRYTVTRTGDVFVYALGDARSSAAAGAVADFAAAVDETCRELYGEPSEAAQLHVLQMPAFGDIASGNAIGISDAEWWSFSASEGAGVTLAHELVHRYVIPPIPRADPLFALVVEGFPSYFHLPVLDRLLGEGFLDRTLRRTEREYLARRAGGGLPELPLAELRPEDVGTYKDVFVLNDRALLLCDFLRRRMGDEAFGRFVRRLFALERLDRRRFEELVEDHLPGSSDELALWLDTTEYPPELRLGD